MSRSAVVQALMELAPEDRRAWIRSMPAEKQARIRFDFQGIWARTDQRWNPGAERHLFVIAGRGWGKTRFGAESTRTVAYEAWWLGGRKRRSPTDRRWGVGARLGICGRTANDRNQTLLYGDSGLITISPPWFKPHHHKSDAVLEWPNGTIGRLFSGEEPASFRGPNFGFVWNDEFVHWAKAEECWEMAMLGLRRGERTYSLNTSTPVGSPLLVRLLWELDANGDRIPDPNGFQGYKIKSRTRVIGGSTLDNVDHLATDFIEDTVGGLVGTRLGEQEVDGIVLLDVPGAPFKRSWLRRCSREEVPTLDEIVVAVDPAGTKKKKVGPGSAETGIVVVGVDRKTEHLYLLEDCSGNYSGAEWGLRAIRAVHQWRADRIVCEDNYGKDLVEINIQNAAIDDPRGLPDVQRVQANRSKFARAQLVNTLWEKGRVFHVGDNRHWTRVEHQMTQYDPAKADDRQMSDRMDAAVWGALALMGDGSDRRRARVSHDADTWQAIADAFHGGGLDGPGRTRSSDRLGQGDRIITLHAWRREDVAALAELARAA